MTSWKGSTMRKSSYDAHTPYDSNHALAGVLNGTQTYWSRGAATLRYFHEPVPAWSWQTPDGDCGWTHHPQEACLVAMTKSEEHTSELQSLMRISYAVFCLNKKI